MEKIYKQITDDLDRQIAEVGDYAKASKAILDSVTKGEITAKEGAARMKELGKKARGEN